MEGDELSAKESNSDAKQVSELLLLSGFNYAKYLIEHVYFMQIKDFLISIGVAIDVATQFETEKVGTFTL